MTIARKPPETEAVNEADRLAGRAEEIADMVALVGRGQAYAGEDHIRYGVLAQAHATLALHQELRAFRLQLDERMTDLIDELTKLSDHLQSLGD